MSTVERGARRSPGKRVTDGMSTKQVNASDAAANTVKHLKLRHLSCALDVARTGSVSAAAQALCVTESAVSKTLRELEEQLGVRLFERSRKGMALTESGRQFTNYAHSALEALHTGVAVASGQRIEPATVLKIAAMTVVSVTFLPELVRRFLAANRDSLVEISSGSGALLLERLREGNVELVLGRCPPRKEMTGLVFEQLYVDRHIFVARKGHPLSALSKVAPSRIGAFPIVMPPRESPLWEEIHQFFLARNMRPTAAQIEALDLQFCRAFTLTSDAVWIASKRAVGTDLKLRSLVQLPLDSPTFETPVGIITRRNGSSDPQLARLIELTRHTSTQID
jgi:LysR family transcriptional regulator, pca operon transcriptional activator